MFWMARDLNGEIRTQVCWTHFFNRSSDHILKSRNAGSLVERTFFSSSSKWATFSKHIIAQWVHRTTHYAIRD